MSVETRVEAPASVEELRRHLREMWSAVAGAWEWHADFVQERGAEITRQLLAETAPRPGERVLELACGAGDVGLAAARLVAPGEVVVSDISAEMVAIAARRAEAGKLANVTARTFGVEAIESNDATFDVVLCREGLMFAAVPALALSEIARVLRVGGRAAVAVWGPKTRNPWLGVVFDAVSVQLGRPVPPPGIPGPFALADRTALRRLFAAAGMHDVAVREVSVPLAARSFDEWWHRGSALAGPLATILAALPQAAKRDLESRLRAASAPFATQDGGLLFPGLALVASGRRVDQSQRPR